ncbi:uncharacterized protein LOC106087711 [Stomoxys calcitrans]|uniref:uncharacterized protein LOC106087711 n=1 Tax=Stomoxys calcitrans TaxID=35570 RepID=UPI0027E38D27|nr:uncharacterized protein LOC106087711 [Stomoxys calcitrans]
MTKYHLILWLNIAFSLKFLVAAGQNTNLLPQRYRLIEYAFHNLNKITWSEEVLNQTTLYLSDLKEWTLWRNQTFVDLNIFEELQQTIDTNLNVLKELKHNPESCSQLWKAKAQHNQLKQFQSLIDDEQVLREWMERDRILMRRMLYFTIRKYKKFFDNLQLKVEEYLNNLQPYEAMMETTLQQWIKKFKSENDFVERLFLMTEFTNLFKEEMNELVSNCMIS